MVMLGCRECGSWDDCDCSATRPLRDEIRDLRAQRDALAEALREVGAWSEDEQACCWCSIPSMIPYRGHDGGCEAARAALAKVES